MRVRKAQKTYPFMGKRHSSRGQRGQAACPDLHSDLASGRFQAILLTPLPSPGGLLPPSLFPPQASGFLPEQC